MKISIFKIGMIILFVIFGGVLSSKVMGVWTTSSDKIPKIISEGEYAGTYDVSDIRGSYTFDDVSYIFDIDIDVLYEAFHISKEIEPTLIQTKDVESLYSDSGVEVGNESVQVFVALYKGLPIEIADVFLPVRAIEILQDINTELTVEQNKYLDTHGTGYIPITNNSINVEEEEEKFTINGSTTFQQVLDKGVSRDDIEIIIIGKIPWTNEKIKDFCLENEMEFSSVKSKLNDLIQD